MSRFARTPEEAFQRRRELIDKKRKQGYAETFFLYQIILMHSWARGVSEKTLNELCEIYNLEYHNSIRRLRILRDKSWVEDTDKYIRPLLIHRAKSSVVSTPDSSVRITPPSVKITPVECKNYTENGKIGVIFTPENPATGDSQTVYGDAKTSFKFKPDLEGTAAARQTDDSDAAVAAETDGHKSNFSFPECLRYAEICQERGEPIKSAHALAKSIYKTGEQDASVAAALFPEQTIVAPVAAADAHLADALEILTDVQASGENVADFEKYYTPADWTYLIGELNEHVG